MIIGAVFGLVQLLVTIGIIVLIVRAVRHVGGGAGRDLQSYRRVVQYVFLLGALAAGAIGVAELLNVAFTRGIVAGRQTEQLALGLALTIVAVPVWLLLWRWLARSLRSDPDERASGGWALYLVLAATGGLITAVVNLVLLGDGVTGVRPFAPGALAYASVAVPVWAVHTWLLRHPTLAPTTRFVDVGPIAGSVVGLVALAVGVGGVLAYALDQLYWLAVGPPLALGPVADTLWHGLIVTAVAVPVWWWHWWRQVEPSPRDVLWHTYVLLVAILGGLAVTVGSVGVMVATGLEWLLAEPTARAAAHFSELPVTLAAATVGLTAWRYHHGVLAKGAIPGLAPIRTEPERVYGYLAAGVGLVAAAAGATVAIVAAIEAIIPTAIAASDPGSRMALVWGLTLLLVGLPVWSTFWRRLQHHARLEVSTELGSVSRRTYLFALLGLSSLIATVSLAVIMFVVFRDLLESSLTLEAIRELRVAIGLVLTAGGLAAYHLAVHRDDRALLPTAPPTPGREIHPRRVLLVSPDGRALASAVATETGTRVRSLHRLDSGHLDVDPHTVAAAIMAAHHQSVLVTIEPDGGIHVIPYEE